MIAYPVDLKRWLPTQLPGRPYVDVVPRDAHEHRCAAYAVDHWEIIAYYTDLGHSLDELHKALLDIKGIYQTMIHRGSGPTPVFWPISYRDIGLWRPQVRALMTTIDRTVTHTDVVVHRR